jgi:hypothetical protein
MVGPKGRSGRLRKIPTSTGIRSPNRLARIESLRRLSYPHTTQEVPNASNTALSVLGTKSIVHIQNTVSEVRMWAYCSHFTLGLAGLLLRVDSVTAGVYTNNI